MWVWSACPGNDDQFEMFRCLQKINVAGEAPANIVVRSRPGTSVGELSYFNTGRQGG